MKKNLSGAKERKKIDDRENNFFLSSTLYIFLLGAKKAAKWGFAHLRLILLFLSHCTFKFMRLYKTG